MVNVPCRLHEVVGCRCREKFEEEKRLEAVVVCGTLAISELTHPDQSQN